MNLSARPHESRVLNAWLSTQVGSAKRLGREPAAKAVTEIVALGENSSRNNLTIEELVNVLGIGEGTAAGAAVTPETAMRVSAVYGCVSLIAGAISTLPLAIYEREGNIRRRADHEYWWLFNEEANADMTSVAAWEYMLCAKLFYGDGFAELERSSVRSSRAIAWRPLHPLRVHPYKTSDGWIKYRVHPEHGSSYVLDPADMLHLPSLGFDGLTSPSPITYAAREAIGTALASEEFSARFFRQGATSDIALKTTSKLDGKQADELRANWLAKYGGGKNSRMPLILQGGLEAQSLSINNVDAALLPTRLFTVEEICRIFGVPPHMVGHTDKATSFGTGIEQQGIGFVRYTLRRHLTGIAQELNRKLWPIRQKYFVEHVTQALESGDLKGRNEAYRVALGRAGEPGWMTRNEIRRLENMPPVDGGDEVNGAATDAQSTTQPAV